MAQLEQPFWMNTESPDYDLGFAKMMQDLEAKLGLTADKKAEIDASFVRAKLVVEKIIPEPSEDDEDAVRMAYLGAVLGVHAVQEHGISERMTEVALLPDQLEDFAMSYGLRRHRETYALYASTNLGELL